MPFWGAAETVQDLFAFLILGFGRLRETQFIYEDTRENAFFIIWDLYQNISKDWLNMWEANLVNNLVLCVMVLLVFK